MVYVELELYAFHGYMLAGSRAEGDTWGVDPVLRLLGYWVWEFLGGFLGFINFYRDSPVVWESLVVEVRGLEVCGLVTQFEIVL